VLADPARRDPAPPEEARQPADSANAKSIADADQTSTLPAFLKATSNPLCPVSFPRGYRFVGKTEPELQALFRAIWRDGRSRGDYVVAISPGGGGEAEATSTLRTGAAVETPHAHCAAPLTRCAGRG
jgi:hypothetical protein